MTFKEVAVKNFRAHIRRYLSYFICSSFSVMIFFMYSTVLLNERLTNSDQVASRAMEGLVLPTAALVVFAVIFISYAHSSFIKSRQQEFGLFMSLGMSIRQIVKIIVIENGLVALASTFVGVISGVVFARIFFILVLRVLQVRGIEFTVPYRSFLATIGTFSLVFLVAITTSIITAYRFQPVQLLKSRRMPQHNKVSSPLAALAGIIMMAGSILSLCLRFASIEGIDGGSLLVFTGICLAGLYITVSQLGGVLLKVARKRKQVYYKNLRLITGLDYRFNQTKKIIFATTVMIMITTFYCGAMFYFLSSAEKTAVASNPYHVAFIQLSDKNNIPETQLSQLLASGETALTQHQILEALKVDWIFQGQELNPRKVISADSLNELTGSNLRVKRGHHIKLNQFALQGDGVGSRHIGEDVTLRTGARVMSFEFQEAVHRIYFNRLKTYFADIILLNDNDYKALRNSAHISDVENIHLMNFADWKVTGSIVRSLNEAFKAYNETTQKNAFVTSFGETEEEFFSVLSRMEDYLVQKQGGSILLFVAGFLGLFFFIAASVILSFRLFSEVGDDISKYRQLSSIGIRDREIKRTINQELGLVFLIPVILGAILSFLYVYTFSRDGAQQGPALLQYNLLASSLYLAFQTIYYLIVRKLYGNKIIQSLMARV